MHLIMLFKRNSDALKNFWLKKCFLKLFFLALIIVLIQGIILAWGSWTGLSFNTHAFILKEAYKRLENDPAFRKDIFPLLSAILVHEGISMEQTGLGPDAILNSVFSDHYYNPRTKEGDAPKQSSFFFSQLQGSIEMKIMQKVAEKSAAYLAHYIADMSVPFHVLGISAPDKNFIPGITDAKGRILLNENIQGNNDPFLGHNWSVELGRWRTEHDNNSTFVNWFDPWYFDDWKTWLSTHIDWERTVSHVSAAGPNEYSPLYTSLLEKKNPNGSQQIISEMTKERARTTRNHLDREKGYFALYDKQEALNEAINDVFTVWRATFSALQPLVSIEQDPVNGLNKLIVHLRNLEDTEAAKDINVHVEVIGGELTGPDNWKIPLLEPFVKNERDNQIDIDKLTIDSSDNEVWIKVIVTGKYVETPDSGKTVLEKKLIIPPKTKKISRIFIKPSSCIIEKGRDKDLVVYAEYTDGSPETIIDSGVSWTSDEKKIAAVNNNGNVKAEDVGKTIIRAKVGGYRADATVEVQKVKIKIGPNPLTLTQIGETYQLQLFKEYPSTVSIVNTGVIWLSDKRGIVSVDPNTGVVTAEAEGEATITAEYGGDRTTGKVFVVLKTGKKKKKTITLLKFIVKPPEWKNAKQGDKKTFKAFAVFSDNKKTEIDVSNKCDWFPSDQNVISVNNGLIEILKPIQGNYSVEVVYTYDGKKNTVVIPIVTLGCPDKITIPDLMGKTVDEARKMIEPCLVLSPTVSPTFDPNYLPGQIVGQIPSRGIIKAKGSKVVVAFNPLTQKPQIDIKIVRAVKDKVELAVNRRSFPVGTEITFKEDTLHKNPLNTYIFDWYVDGNLIRGMKDLIYTFDVPGPHYVQLVMTSSDPTEDDAIIKNINIENPIESPPEPECAISASPSPPYSPPITITFTMNCKNLDTSTITAYNWYVDDNLKLQGINSQFSWNFDKPGSYEIKCVIQRGSNVNEITASITVMIGVQAPKPDARWKNKFEARESEKGLEILANYWIGGLGKWSDWSGFRNLGEVDGYALCTGEQADLYNTGFLLYSPKGSGKLLFEVYRYDYERLRGILVNSGSVNMHGKTFLPDSVSVIKCQSRAADFQWRTEDGSLCKARVWKYIPSGTGTITQNEFLKSGAEDLGCIELSKKIDTTKIASGGSIIEAIKTTARIMNIQPAEVTTFSGTRLEKQLIFLEDNKISRPVCMYFVEGDVPKGIEGAMSVFVFPSEKEAEDAIPKWRDYFKTYDKRLEPTISTENFHGLSAFFWTFKHLEDRKFYGMAWVQGNVWSSFTSSHYYANESKTREVGEILYEELNKIVNREGLIACEEGDAIRTDGPIIKELASPLGSIWPARLQEGKLDVRGAEAGKFKWSDSWITVGTGVTNFWGIGTDQGPVVIYTKGPKEWCILTLNYASGTQENVMNFTEPVKLIKGGTWGAYIKVGEKCYEYSRSPLRAVDCETFRYIYKNEK